MHLYKNLAKADFYRQYLEDNHYFDTTNLKRFDTYFKSSFTFASCSMEGNSLSEKEVFDFLRNPKEQALTHDYKQIKAHADAFVYMVSLRTSLVIREESIKKIHSILTQPFSVSHAGKYKDLQSVDEMKTFCKWMSNQRKKYVPIAFGAEVYYRFLQLHPFDDNNELVARLLMNAIFIQNQYPIITISPFIYEEYSIAFKQSIDEFVEFIFACVIENEKDIMRLMDLPIPKY